MKLLKKILKNILKNIEKISKIILTNKKADDIIYEYAA